MPVNQPYCHCAILKLRTQKSTGGCRIRRVRSAAVFVALFVTLTGIRLHIC